MEAINHEYYVSLEVAKLLKEAGFDWETEFGQHVWDSSKRLETNRNFNSEKYLVSLPTLEVAQRWLRETQKYHVEVSYAEEKGYLPIYFLYKTNITQNFVFYPTYEEALEAGIKKCLTVLLEK